MKATSKGLRSLAAGAAALLAALALCAAAAVNGPLRSASAAGAQVQVTVDGGGTLNPDGPTTLDLTGSGFQSIQGGFGGIYVLFGWVSDPNGGSWKPSQGGKTGENYKYVPDDESNPTGYDVFVAFPGSSTEAAANGGTIAADGTWHAKMTVPGAAFTSMDRAGNPSPVDCLSVQCGVITIGAHGVTNTSNETFTPVAFSTAASEAPVAAPAADAGDGNAAAGAGTDQQAAATKSGQQSDQQGTTATDAGTATDTQTGTATDAAGQADAQTAAANTASRTASQGATGAVTTVAAVPALGITGWLMVAAAVMFGLTLVVLAAGAGGYLAAKALLLGVSPVALEKEMARRERKAEHARHKERLRGEKRRRRQYRQLARAQAEAEEARSRAEVPAVAQVAGPDAAQAADLEQTQVLRPQPSAAGSTASLQGFFLGHGSAAGEANVAATATSAVSAAPAVSVVQGGAQ